jgi:ribonuclease P protein component
MSRGARPEGLSRRHRFRGQDCFRPVLRSPRKHSGSLAVLHIARTPAASRFGIAIGKRSAKQAVERNQVRRRAKELFRRHGLKQSKVDVVVTLTHRYKPALLDALMTELAELFDRASSSP